MFNSQMRESTAEEVRLQDVSGSVLRHLVGAAYTGEVARLP